MGETVVISAQRAAGWAHWNPYRTFLGLWQYHSLIGQLVRRDLAERYKGSFLGAAWTVLTPFVVLGIYSFVFNVVLKARWGVTANEGRLEFALALFSGLVVWGVFSECAILAPGIILNNRSYAKRTVFPLEVLPVVNLLSALARAGAGMAILVAGVLLTGTASWKLPLALLWFAPVALFALGVSWLLAALGVFLRDVGHITGLAVHLLFFLTPIVYPVSSVPERMRPVINANPFTHIVSAVREMTVWGLSPDWRGLAILLLVSVAVFQAGYGFFAATRRGFCDVL